VSIDDYVDAGLEVATASVSRQLTSGALVPAPTAPLAPRSQRSSVVAIVCAKDEAPRIGVTLTTLANHPRNDRVLVVDDGSTDETAAEAASYGADVLKLSPNRGKGRAMLAGLCATTEPIVLFADADLIGFSRDHVDAIVCPLMHDDRYDMIVGMNDYGQWTEVSRAFPLISGQRAVRRSYLEAMPVHCWSGFGIEVSMNDAVYRLGGKTGTVHLDGLQFHKKWDKEAGPARGVRDMVKMAGEIVQTMEKRAPRRPSHPAGPKPALPPTTAVATDVGVVDAMLDSAVRVAGPYVRDELWTPEARKQVGDAIGRKVAQPMWVGAVALLGLAGTGVAWLLSRNSPRRAGAGTLGVAP